MSNKCYSSRRPLWLETHVRSELDVGAHTGVIQMWFADQSRLQTLRDPHPNKELSLEYK